MSGGFDKLAEQACDFLSGSVSFMDQMLPGDSTIERLFVGALYCHCLLGASELERARLIKDDEHLEQAKSKEHTKAWLLIQSQVQLPFGRVDFLVHAYDEEADAWKVLVVECDGHDFHERTKEQAAKDRSRDREAQLAGYSVFRFTGSELWRDPWGCAAKVVTWAGRDYK
jgi:very-short-patch-repair endonuclease